MSRLLRVQFTPVAGVKRLFKEVPHNHFLEGSDESLRAHWTVEKHGPVCDFLDG